MIFVTLAKQKYKVPRRWCGCIETCGSTYIIHSNSLFQHNPQAHYCICNHSWTAISASLLWNRQSLVTSWVSEISSSSCAAFTLVLDVLSWPEQSSWILSAHFWCRIHLWFRYVGGVCKASRWRHRATVPAHRHACARNTETLQLQDGGYALLWKRYNNNNMAAIRYYENVMTSTKWRLCVAMKTLWQQQNNKYGKIK